MGFDVWNDNMVRIEQSFASVDRNNVKIVKRFLLDEKKARLNRMRKRTGVKL